MIDIAVGILCLMLVMKLWVRSVSCFYGETAIRTGFTDEIVRQAEIVEVPA